MGAETVEGAIFLVVSNYAFAFAIFHYQVKGEVFDKIVGVVSEGLAV